MKIFVNVRPNSKTLKIEKIDKTHFNVWVKEPPKEGKANKAVIKAVAECLNISKYMVNIISGAFSRQKVIEIK